MTSSRLTTIVVGGRVFQTMIDACERPRSMRVTIRVDFEREWVFDEPGWSELSYGLSDSGLFIWSARHLFGVPSGPGDDASEFRTDEDILFVFAADGRWLVVCETSVRLYDGPREASRVGLGEVAVSASWNLPVLSVHDQRDRLVLIRLLGDQLRAEVQTPK